MKRNEKIRAKEIEMQKQAAAKTNAQVIFNQIFNFCCHLLSIDINCVYLGIRLGWPCPR